MKTTSTEQGLILGIVICLLAFLYNCKTIDKDQVKKAAIQNGTQMISTVDSSIVGVYNWEGGSWLLPTVAYKNDNGEIISKAYKEGEWLVK